MRPVLLLVPSLLVACADQDPGPGPDPEEDDLWVIERVPGAWNDPEPPNCPDFAAPEREIRLRGRQVEATAQRGAHYELIALTAEVRVIGDQGVFGGTELSFDTEETWPLAGGGSQPVHVYYSDLAAPALGYAGTTIYVTLDDPNGPPDYGCARPLQLVSVRRD